MKLMRPREHGGNLDESKQLVEQLGVSQRGVMAWLAHVVPKLLRLPAASSMQPLTVLVCVHPPIPVGYTRGYDYRPARGPHHFYTTVTH